ncbi:hypothetical protein AOY75_17640 [Escherichia coli]|nr:hypothetical protein [Escherichia coli]UMS07566.1 hypothetical protein AOY85_06465 [Escherichia coli]UMS54866.1 hypothetical protein AOY75_17640 [Escherichia coli]
MPDATLCESYQAYGLWAKCRPDKAFTPHPAAVRRCLMRRFSRLIRPTVYERNVGRIRRSRRIRQSCTIINAYSVYWRGTQYARQ